MKKRGIDFVTLSPLLLLTLLPVGILFASYFTQTAAHPETAFFKYFAIPLIGFSTGSIIFLGIVRNDWKMSDRWLSFIEKHLESIIFAATCIFLLGFSIFAVLRYTSLHTSVFDMGTFDRKIWRISVAPLSAITYEVSLGHFQPIWVFYGLIYKFIDSPVILQVLQAIAALSGVIPLYLTAKSHLHHKGYILLIIIVYLLYPAVGFNAALDFHADHLYIPLMLWAFYFAEKESYIKAVLFAALGALIKEPLILGSAFFGLYLVFEKKQYKVGVPAFLIFLILFLIVIYIILPHIKQSSVFQGGSFPFLENNTQKVNIISSIKSLINTLLMWKMRKLLFIYFLLAPLLFLPLLEWRRFLPATPLIAIPLLSTAYLHSSVDSQYTAGIVAPAFIALVFSIKRVEERLGIKYANAFMASVMVMTITFHIAHGPSPLSISFWKSGWAEIWHKSNYISGEHEAVIKRAIYNIPENPNKMVISQGNINHARLAHRYKYWVFPYKWENTDYILLDLNRPLLMGDRIDEEAYIKELQKILNSSIFQIEFQEDAILLFKRIARNMAN